MFVCMCVCMCVCMYTQAMLVGSFVNGVSLYGWDAAYDASNAGQHSNPNNPLITL